MMSLRLAMSFKFFRLATKFAKRVAKNSQWGLFWGSAGKAPPAKGTGV